MADTARDRFRERVHLLADPAYTPTERDRFRDDKWDWVEQRGADGDDQ